jgi:diguanylate cyclase
LINDRLSYAVGDRVLQRIASILAEAVRDSDLLARYGGEEFALLMPGTTADEAPAVVNRLRAHVADHDWTSVHPKLSVTMSAGVCAHARASFASMPTSDLVTARLSMLERADQALRAAKTQGRDRTIVVRY